MSDNIITRRISEGVYTNLHESLKAWGANALAGAEYGVDYFCEKEPEQWSNNYRFLDASGNTLNLLVFSQITTDGFGTLLSAKGNHKIGVNNDVSWLSPPKCSRQQLPYHTDKIYHRHFSRKECSHIKQAIWCYGGSGHWLEQPNC